MLNEQEHQGRLFLVSLPGQTDVSKRAFRVGITLLSSEKDMSDNNETKLFLKVLRTSG